MALISSIDSEDDYNRALARLGEILRADVGTPERDERDHLIDLLEAYEEPRGDVGLPSIPAAIEFHMRRLGPHPRRPSSPWWAAGRRRRRCCRAKWISPCPWPVRSTSTGESLRRFSCRIPQARQERDYVTGHSRTARVSWTLRPVGDSIGHNRSPALRVAGLASPPNPPALPPENWRMASMC